MKPFPHSLEHILAELARLDILLRVQVWRARQLAGDKDNLHAFYIPEDEVDALSEKPVGVALCTAVLTDTPTDSPRTTRPISPEEVPRSEALDLAMLANTIELAGGNIRDLSLTAAFLAAADRGTVTMQHLVQATQREYQKMGKELTNNFPPKFFEQHGPEHIR